MTFPLDHDHVLGRGGRDDESEKYKFYAHFCKVGGAQVNLASLVSHLKISLQSTENGVSRNKSEVELIQEVDYRLKMKSHCAWHAETQVSNPDSSLSARTLIPVEGISTTSSYIPLAHEDILPIREGWGPSLCGMFAGRVPGKDAVYNLVRRWGVSTNIVFHSKGWILFCFKSYVDLETVREKGPFSVFGVPLILEPTPANFKLDDRVRLQIPIWIRIPDLPLTLWTKAMVEKIASSVGIPVAVDHSTIRRQSLDGPHVQVIIDIRKDPRDNIELFLPEGVFATSEDCHDRTLLRITKPGNRD